jgi:hypothetical protein
MYRLHLGGLAEEIRGQDLQTCVAQIELFQIGEFVDQVGGNGGQVGVVAQIEKLQLRQHPESAPGQLRQVILAQIQHLQFQERERGSHETRDPVLGQIQLLQSVLQSVKSVGVQSCDQIPRQVQVRELLEVLEGRGG